jgi:hypothetical protein
VRAPLQTRLAAAGQRGQGAPGGALRLESRGQAQAVSPAPALQVAPVVGVPAGPAALGARLSRPREAWGGWPRRVQGLGDRLAVPCRLWGVAQAAFVRLVGGDRGSWPRVRLSGPGAAALAANRGVAARGAETAWLRAGWPWQTSGA